MVGTQNAMILSGKASYQKDMILAGAYQFSFTVDSRLPMPLSNSCLSLYYDEIFQPSPLPQHAHTSCKPEYKTVQSFCIMFGRNIQLCGFISSSLGPINETELQVCNQFITLSHVFSQNQYSLILSLGMARISTRECQDPAETATVWVCLMNYAMLIDIVHQHNLYKGGSMLKAFQFGLQFSSVHDMFKLTRLLYTCTLV